MIAPKLTYKELCLVRAALIAKKLRLQQAGYIQTDDARDFEAVLVKVDLMMRAALKEGRDGYE